MTFRIIIAGTILFGLTSCYCGSKNELAMEAVFSDTEVPVFEKVIAVGANRNVSLTKPLDPENVGAQFLLPINSNTDSCTYLFFRSGQVDTVSITYKRTFEFRHKECGFNLLLSDGLITKNTLSKSASIYLQTASGLGLSASGHKITFWN